MRRLISLVLAATLLVGCSLPVFAGVKIDETAKPNTKGLIVTISTDAPIPQAMAPTMKLSLWNERGSRVLSEATASKENYDEELGQYTVVFGLKSYKAGDEFLLNLDSADPIVGKMMYYDELLDRYYDIIGIDVSPVTIRKEKFQNYDKLTDFDLFLTGSETSPYNVIMVTNEQKVVIQALETGGAPVPNTSFTITREKDKKKLLVKSDEAGNMAIDKAFVTSNCIITSNDKNFELADKTKNRILLVETKEDGALFKQFVFNSLVKPTPTAAPTVVPTEAPTVTPTPTPTTAPTPTPKA